MVANLTLPDSASVADFLDRVEDPQRRADCVNLCKLMERLSGEAPCMWGKAMVGFGSYHYRYESGREGDWFRVGFAPRKRELTLYIMAGFDRYESLMSQLGRHRVGKSCLYIKRLSDIDLEVLEALVIESLRYMAAAYPDAARC